MMTELLACLQQGALLWLAIAFGLVLWLPDFLLGRIERRRETRARLRRLEVAESYWREGLMVWLSPDTRETLSMDVSSICRQIEMERQARTEIPAVFRRAFEEKEKAPWNAEMGGSTGPAS